MGENRAAMAARSAVSSPLLDLSIDGARGVLFNITGGPDLTMYEVDEAARIISASVDPDANIIFGSVIKNDLSDQVRITVIATGFDETQARIAKMSQRATEVKLEGVVTEAPRPKEVEKVEEEKEDKKEDEFGEDFEIPAFLRKIH